MTETVDFIARCIAGSAQETARKAISDLGGMQILKLTKDEYESIEHNSDTIYYVTDGEKVTQYIGNSKMTSGTVSELNTNGSITNGFIGKGIYNDL